MQRSLITDPSELDLDRSIRFNPDLMLRPGQDTLLHSFASGCLRHHGLGLRLQTVELIERALSCLFANLLNARRSSSRCYLAISLRSNDYNRNRYRQHPLSYPNIKRVIEFLRDNDQPYIDFHIGFQDRRGKLPKGRVTRIRATQELIDILYGYQRSKVKDRGEFSWQEVLDEIKADTTPEPITDRVCLPMQIVVSKPTADCIRLRKDGKDIEYEDTPETNRMRRLLTRYNDFISGQNHIDLYIKDDDWEQIFIQGDDEDEKAFDEGPKKPTGLVDLSRTRLHRVFNNGSFDQGGRFYGGWWQNIPSEYRRYLTINHTLTREVDFSNLHAAMLYAMEGLPLEEDAYVLPGLDTPAGRKLVKTTFFKLVNALPEQRVRAPKKDSLPEGWTWKAVQEALREKHKPMSCCRFPGHLV